MTAVRAANKQDRMSRMDALYSKVVAKGVMKSRRELEEILKIMKTRKHVGGKKYMGVLEDLAKYSSHYNWYQMVQQAKDANYKAYQEAALAADSSLSQVAIKKGFKKWKENTENNEDAYAQLRNKIDKKAADELANSTAVLNLVSGIFKIASTTSDYRPGPGAAPAGMAKAPFLQELEMINDTIEDAGLKFNPAPKTGGAGPGASAAPGAPGAAGASKSMDDMVKNVQLKARDILNIMDGLKSKYLKSYTHTLLEPATGSSTTPPLTKLKEKLDQAKTDGEAAAKKAAEAAAEAAKTAKGAPNNAPTPLTNSENEIVAISKSLAEDESKWIKDELPANIKDIKASLSELQATFKQIILSDPNDPDLTSFGISFGKLMEGDMDYVIPPASAPEDGYKWLIVKDLSPSPSPTASEVKKQLIMSSIDTLLVKMTNIIKSEYDQCVNELKGPAGGLAQRQKLVSDYANRQVVNGSRYGGGEESAWSMEGGTGDSVNLTNPLKGKDYIELVNFLLEKRLLVDIVKPLGMKVRMQTGPDASGVVGASPGLLDDIYKKYDKSRKTEGRLISALSLENMLNATDMNPSKVLAITNTDKIIFVFVIIMIRFVSNLVIEYFISKNWVTSIKTALVMYIVLYTLIFALLVGAVNFDLYRLRIMFNYVNMHSNMATLFVHIILAWLLIGVIMLVISSVNFPMNGLVTTTDRDEDKAYLMYQLELSTMFLWLFLVIVIMVF